MSYAIRAKSLCFVVITVMLLGLNLRPVLAGVGPLLSRIQAATGMGDTQAGLLTTLPVFAMGICALYGGWLQSRLGEYRGIGIGIVGIAVACLLRCWLTGTTGLLLTAALAGIGIALIQALMPSFLRRSFSRQSSRLMGLYTTAIMAGAALAAASVSPLADIMDWDGALAIWGVLATLATLAWLITVSLSPMPDTALRAGSMSASPRSRAWALMIFFGIGTAAYTLVLAWLPPYYTQLGWSPAHSGLLLGGLTLTEVVAGLLVSLLINRFPDRRYLLLPVLLLLLLGMTGLILAPQTLVLPIMIALGLGIGALFPLSLIIALDQVDDPRQASALMGFVQGGGYLIASLMPLLAGVIRQYTSGLGQAWLIMAAGVVVLILMALRFAPRHPVPASA
ncbi:putative transporter YycB [Dickeya dianthicola]|uniref:MFS transporter n=1 Tax=Dickeya dianthicola TaxID=204039 RepID=A0ABX9NIA0_9GAMM|nr:MFS transporter [Dickeya dianthicola]ATO32721.1 Cyanate transport protein CynX [Dickeya dianthicola RNS04.9]AYC18684.1 putative transporter YycB [Dickeya dianthicola]MBI0437244.1 CynX/NimT family MFS transporter [Dickeya dianthicola]MBI0449319.1 CynX/NimT family MFS transporter [Dickeya dianthicola]MBI0454715.1 CynX/NimT family MFS transporter [Dickeya dianthicola]